MPSQGLSAYVDVREKFHVFDRGTIRQLDFLPVTSYAVGWNALVFVDHSGEFHLYCDGVSQKLNAGTPYSYESTRDLVVYRIGSLLNVVDRGVAITLMLFADDYPFAYGDSIVAYGNSVGGFEVYHHGKKTELDFEMPIDFKVGTNCVAYVTKAGEFKVFARGRTTIISTAPPKRFLVGEDLVAYVDEYENFMVWWDEAVWELDNFLPGYFEVGDDLVIYFDHLGSFKVFQYGAVTELMQQAPGKFRLKHRVVIYLDERGMLTMFSRGKAQVIDNFWPTYLEIEDDLVAWSNKDGILMANDGGQGYKVSEAVVDGRFRIDGQVVRYIEQANEVRFWWEGKRY
jgi:hypothetical protein